MGVDLGDVIPRRRVELASLSNRKLAVDAYNTLYQFLAIIRGVGGEHLKDSSGRVTSHLSGLFYRNINLMELNIKLVYVFDGAPPELKTEEIRRRRKVREEAGRQYVEAVAAGDMAGARKYAEASTSLRDDMIVDSKRLLDAMGIPWIDAPSEGEAQASVMAAEGTVDGVASQDHDSLLFGAPLLVRNVTISGRRRLPSKNVFIDVEPESISLAETLHDLQLTREQLVDLGILVGTDFNPDGFKGVGPARALKFLRTYGSLEKVEPLRGSSQGSTTPRSGISSWRRRQTATSDRSGRSSGPTRSRLSWSMSTPSRQRGSKRPRDGLRTPRAPGTSHSRSGSASLTRLQRNLSGLSPAAWGSVSPPPQESYSALLRSRDLDRSRPD
jgi:flap endonuclease-1